MKQEGVVSRMVRYAQSDHGSTVVLVLVLGLTLLIHLAWFVHTRNHVIYSDEVTYHTMAFNWSHGKGMSMDGIKPTAIVGPAYPAFVAIVYRLFGVNHQAVYILQILLALVTAYTTYRIGLILIGSRVLSLVALCVLAVDWRFIQYTSLLLTEALFTMLLAVSIFALLLAFERKSLPMFALAGVLTGVAALCRPTVLPLPALVFCIALAVFQGQKKKIALSTGFFTLGIMLAMSPWVIRNYTVMHAFVPGSTEGGEVFWGGTCGKYGDFKERTSTYKLPPHVQRFLDSNPSEIEKNAFYAHDCIRYIKRNPAQYAFLSVRKFFRLWLNTWYADPPTKRNMVFAVGYLAFLCLALSSVRVVKNRPALYVILAVLGLFTLVHMLTVSTGRYAQPLMPYVVLLAMKGLSRFSRPLAQAG